MRPSRRPGSGGRGRGKCRVASLVHGGSAAAGTGPLHSGSLFFAGARGRTLRKKHRSCGSVVPPLARRPALKGLEKAKVGGARGSRGARAGVCGQGGLEGGGEARVAAWSTGSTCGGVTPPVPVGSSCLGPPPTSAAPIEFCFCAFCREEPFLLAWKPWCSRSEKVGQYWWGSDFLVCPQPKAAKAATTAGTWSESRSGPGCRGPFELFPTLTLPRKI